MGTDLGESLGWNITRLERVKQGYLDELGVSASARDTRAADVSPTLRQLHRPVPGQGASVHARILDLAGPSEGSR
jgi:hypothetical protein